MARQTLQPDQWLVCGEDLEGYEFHQGQEVIERKPELSELHSICMNCLEAMKHVKGDKLFVVDDDDWIRDDYLAVMDSALDMADLVGTAPAFYFHVGSRKWRNMKNHAHCSLGQTGFTSKVFDCFLTCCRNKSIGPWIDMMLWPHWSGTLQGSSLILPNEERKPGHVGLKGIPWGSTKGAGLGHDPNCGIRDLSKLRQWIGDDYWNYYSADRRTLL